jgi:hypothetical protein
VKTLITIISFFCLVTLASAQTIPVINNGPHDYYPFGPTPMSNNINFARVVFSAGTLHHDGVMTVLVELSLNGGVSYIPAGGRVFTAANQPTEFVLQLAEPFNGNRMLRGSINVLGEKWNRPVRIELEP